jgi:flagellar M-ring protein FliF
VRQPVGAIKRLSVGVVLNYRKTTDKAGKVSYAPLSQAEMTQISNLVKEAMGFSQTRGDTLNVVNAAFSLAEAAEAAPALPAWKDPGTIALAKEVVKNLLIAGVLFYLVFGVLRPLFRDLVRLREQAAPPPETLMEAEAGAARQGAAGYEENLRSAKELAKSEPKIVASVVKEWVEHGE